MKYPRKQTDSHEKNAKYGAITAIDCSDLPDMVHPEFLPETDINLMLARFGVNPYSIPQRQPAFGAADYTMDLQTAMITVEQAQRAWRKLTPEMRAIFPDWRTFLNGIADGTVDQHMRDLANARTANYTTDSPQHGESEWPNADPAGTNPPTANSSRRTQSSSDTATSAKATPSEKPSNASKQNK